MMERILPCLDAAGEHRCHEPAEHDPPHRCFRCGLEWPDEGLDNPDADGSTPTDGNPMTTDPRKGGGFSVGHVTSDATPSMSMDERTATMPPSTGICSECGHERFLDLDGLVQYHDWPRFTRRVCPGAKKSPVLNSASTPTDGNPEET